MPTKIYLLRHGQALNNVVMSDQEMNDGVLRDAALTETGHTQSLEIKPHINGIRFHAIYCSPLQRCRQTLKAVYPRSVYLPVELDDRLLEQPYGTHIYNMRQERDDVISTSPVNWVTTRVSESNPHVLTAKQAEYDLIRGFINELLRVHPDETVLIVCHGKWINRFLKTYCGVSQWVRNCELLEVTLSNTHTLENTMAQDMVPQSKRFKSS